MTRSLFVVALVGCATSPTDTIAPPDIGQGVFGQIHNSCDAPDCQPTPTTGAFVNLFRDMPALGVVASTFETNDVSDQHGRYELAADLGAHYVCVSDESEGGGYVPRSCASITVSAQAVTRIDYAYGPDGGRWYVP
jgi:hypothetical protein